MDDIEFNLNAVFHDIVNRMESEGALDHDAYLNYIDDVLEEKESDGILDPDANVKNYKESLELMWPQAEDLISKTDVEGVAAFDDDSEPKLPRVDEDA